MLKEIRTRGDIILFIDELHTLVGAGAAEGAIDAASILKPMLARGELQTIGATTLDEYRKHLEKDAALERRFQPIKVEEPTVAHTIEILKGLRDRYEAHHRVTITDQALVAAANLADRYISDRHLPDKAIDLIDEAGSRLRIRRMQTPPDYKELENEIAQSSARRRRRRSRTSSSRRPASSATRRRRCSSRRTAKEQEIKDAGIDLFDEVDEESIAEVLSIWTGIPVYKLTEEETAKLLRMEDELHKRVIGQEDAIKAVSQAIRRTRAGLKDPKRPERLVHLPRPVGRGEDRAGQDARRVPVRRRAATSSSSTCPSTWRSTRSAGWSARPPATWATRRAASSPRPCGASRSRSCSSTRSRRPTPTCSTRCCRSSRTAASPTRRAARSTSATPC